MTARAPLWRRILAGLTGTDHATYNAVFDKLIAAKQELAFTRMRLDGACDEIEHLRHALAAKDRENDALRTALADLGRQLHGGDASDGDTLPMPRVRSHAAPGGTETQG